MKELQLGNIVRTQKGYFVVVRRSWDDQQNVTGYTFCPLDVSSEINLSIPEFERAVEQKKIEL